MAHAMRNHLVLPARIPVLASLLALGTSADVLIVAPSAGPGVNATSIQTAVDLAQPGDTILVRDGTYEDFRIWWKGVSVLADGENVSVIANSGFYGAQPAVSIQNIPANEDVVVRGLRTNFGLRVSDCDGPVWFDEMEVQGGLTTGLCSGFSPGAWVTDSAAVTFSACSLIGDAGLPDVGIVSNGPGTGATVGNANAAFYDCHLIGGEGASTATFGFEGGPGLLLGGTSEVLLSNTRLQGGAGGVASSSVCTGSHGLGGPGLSFSTNDTLYSLASTAAGGAADLTALCPGLYGPAGPAIEGTGSIQPLAGYARSLQATSPVRGGADVTFTAIGQPGELPLVLVSERQEPLLLPNLSGSLLIGMPIADVLVLPNVSTTGTSELTLPVPNIGLAVGSVDSYMQAVFIDPAQGLWLGGGCTLTVVDASY